MKKLITILSLLMISGCKPVELTTADKENLPSVAEIQNSLCKGISEKDLVYSAEELPFIEKEYGFKFAGLDGCNFYLDLRIVESKLAILSGGNVSSNLLGAAIGLKAAGSNTRKPEKKKEGVLGAYLEVYSDDEYFGIVYSSENGPKSLMLFVLGIDREDEDHVFGLIKRIEKKNYYKT